MERPLAISSVNRWRMPQMGRQSSTSIVVTHREFLNDVNAGGGIFACNSYPVNPGLGAIFPWLSHLAQNYESYRFRKLEVEYVPFVPTTQAGTIMLAMDFDAADATPLTKAGLMSMQGAVSGPVWGPIKLDCVKANLLKMAESRYSRGGNLAANLDIKTYDVANLNVATASAGVFVGAIGELYLNYTVELITPQYNMADEAADDSAKVIPTANVTKLNLFGSARTVTGNLPITVNPDHIVFQEPGDYLLDMKATGTAFVGNVTPAYSAANIVSTIVGNLVDAAATTMLTTMVVRVPEKNGRVYLDYNAGATTVTALTLRIARYLYTLA